MLQDILSPIIGESSVKSTSVDHTGTAHIGRGTDPTHLDSNLLQDLGGRVVITVLIA